MIKEKDIVNREKSASRNMIDAGLLDITRLKSMSVDEIKLHIRTLLENIEHVRMGGRSISMLSLCSILWYVPTSKLTRIIDCERLIGLGIRISGDPSYVFPQLGLLLSGILIARHSDLLPASIRETVKAQTYRVLSYIDSDSRNFEKCRSLASCLMAAWDIDLQLGVKKASRLIFRHWPKPVIPFTANGDKIDRLAANVSRKLTPCWSSLDWAIYRLFLKREGSWKFLKDYQLL